MSESNQKLGPTDYKDSGVRNGEIKAEPVGSATSSGLSLAIQSHDLTPVVRYASVGENGFRQERTLRPIDSPAPEEAEFISPGIYLLTDEEQERLSAGTPPKNIQMECRRAGRVVYTVVAESDALEDGSSVEQVRDWLTEFITEWVGVDNYELYYSGNRSIHIHARGFVNSEGWNGLKAMAEQFNEENDAKLDTSIYDPRKQFRHVGTIHKETGMQKVPIAADDDRADIISRAHSIPLNRDNRNSTHYVARVPGRTALRREIDNHLIRPLIKDSEAADDPITVKPFSPYALTGDGNRSICILKQTGELFERDEDNYLPCYILEAVGGDADFVRYNSECKVLLSDHDARKWNLTEGDHGVIIGGRSRKSRILEIDQDDANLVSQVLERDGKEDAYELLDHLGFDVGDSGRVNGTSDGEVSDAMDLQYQIEAGDKPFDYDNVVSVACSLLQRRGWDAAWEWIKRHAPEFDPEQTHEYLRNFVETYDAYDHVEIPSRKK